MRLLVRHLDGALQPAILIARFGGHLRVSIPGCDDAVGFRFADGQWLAEDGGVVEIQFDAAPEEFDWCVQQAAEARRVAPRPWVLEAWVTRRRPAASAEPVN